MIEWWNTLELSMKILWAVTLSSSVIFIIQTVLTFLGADGSSDFDVDAGGADSPDSAAEPGTGMGLLTFRNLVDFFLGFGWTAILLHPEVKSTGVLLLISSFVGAALVALVMLLFKWLGSMQQSGNIDVFKQAVGCQGAVYLTIPAERSGAGKVQISIGGCVREYSAVTDGPQLVTGTRIRVVEVVDALTLLVEGLDRQ